MRVEIIQIPWANAWDFVQMHKYVTLVADILFVNGLLLLVTSSRDLILATIKYLSLKPTKCLVHTLHRVFGIFAIAGFVVQVVMMDMEFDKLNTAVHNTRQMVNKNY